MTGKPNYPEGTIYPGHRGWGLQVQRWKGAAIYRVPLFARGKRGALGLVMNYLSFILCGMIFGPWLLRRRGYDAIFVYGVSPIFQAIPALFMGWLKRAPVIIWVQDLWPESLAATGYVRNRHVLACVGWFVGFVYRRADLLLAQSRAFVPLIAPLAPGKPLLYYPNSVDDSFSRPSNSELPDIPALHEGFPVVFAGNIGQGQAVEVIVEAARLLKNHPEVRFVVVGDGSRRTWMCEQVMALGLKNLHLPGRYGVEMMPALMQKAGALLVSLSDEPIFAATVPNKVQAYMAAGKPILASLNGEGARIVNEANAGLSTAAGDAKALADAVMRLFYMSDAERAVLGANGQRYFKQNFDHELLTEQLMSHLSSVSDARRHMQ